jgi:hypothetical protein
MHWDLLALGTDGSDEPPAAPSISTLPLCVRRYFRPHGLSHVLSLRPPDWTRTAQPAGHSTHHEVSALAGCSLLFLLCCPLPVSTVSQSHDVPPHQS